MTSRTAERSNSCGTYKKVATHWPDTSSTDNEANSIRPTKKAWKTSLVPSASSSTPSPSGTPLTSTQQSNNYAKTDTRSMTKTPCASRHICENTSTSTVTTASNKHHQRPAHLQKCAGSDTEHRSLAGLFAQMFLNPVVESERRHPGTR